MTAQKQIVTNNCDKKLETEWHSRRVNFKWPVPTSPCLESLTPLTSSDNQHN